MARIDVKATVSAPQEINISLVRADYAEQANVHRICFEVSLSLFSVIIGVVLTIEKLERIHWFCLIVFGCGALAFLWLTIKIARQAHQSNGN